MSTKTIRRGMVSACAAAAAAAMFSATASAASITVDSVVQRWPWNNKLDITYTVSGGQNVAAETFARIVFTANMGGTAYTIDGVHDVGASANDGTHTVTWTPPAGLRATGCTMTAQLLSADNPSGDDYLIVDLTASDPSEAVSYEGVLASQDDSNARYNVDAYKQSKIVLRKVPAGTYQTGTSGSFKDSNGVKAWTTARAYYIGVFEVTKGQYNRLLGSGNYLDASPKNGISWNVFRANVAPNEQIPEVDSNTGTFLQRLNYKAGNKFGFDLPTEVMYEIAARAGTTTDFYWGSNDMVWANVVGNTSISAVGSRPANPWGLYDMAGNVWDFCLDDTSLSNLADAVDPFTPAYTAGTANRRARGGAYNNNTTNQFRSFYRGDGSATSEFQSYGFRVAYVVK